MSAAIVDDNWFDALDEEPRLRLVDPEYDYPDYTQDDYDQDDQEGEAVTSPQWDVADYRPGGNDGSGAWKLGDSAVAPLIAAARGYETVHEDDLADAIKKHNLPRPHSAQGKRIAESVTRGDILIMPWFTTENLASSWRTAKDPVPTTVQFRPARPVVNEKTGKERKYEFVSGQKTPIGIHPSFTREWIDGAPTVLLAEGMLKGDSAMTSYLLDRGIDPKSLEFDGIGGIIVARARLSGILNSIPPEHRVLVMTLGGVDNWKNNSEWRDIELKGRTTWIGVDGDVATNPNVHRACRDLWEFLIEKKKTTPFLIAPTVQAEGGEKKVGIDDYLAKYGNWNGLVSMVSAKLPEAPPRSLTPAAAARAAGREWKVPSLGGIFGDVPDPRLCEQTARCAQTRMGLAERVHAHYGDLIAYREASDTWLVYTNGVWTPGDLAVGTIVRRVIRSISVHEAGWAERTNEEVARIQARIDALNAAGQTPSTDDERNLREAQKAARKEIETFALSAESNQWANTVLSDLRGLCTVPEDEWDPHPFRINFTNGTVNLKHRDTDGRAVLSPHDPTHRITMQCAVDFAPDAVSNDLTKVAAHFDMSGEGTWKAISRYLGYSITGAMDAKTYLNLWSSKANAAKSTVMDAFQAALGSGETSYAATLDAADLSAGKAEPGKATPGIDALRGKRFVVVAEAQHVHLGSDLMKKWTGGDAVRTRTLHARGGQWQPQGKFLLHGQGPTPFTTSDDGMVERFFGIQLQALPRDQIDTNLRHRLRSAEGQTALMAAVVQAACDWYDDYKHAADGIENARRALRIPAHAEEHKADALRNLNPLSDWLDARCEISDEADLVARLGNTGRCTVGHLCEDYNAWARRSGLPSQTPRRFGPLLAATGLAGTVESEFLEEVYGEKVRVKGRLRTGIRLSSESAWHKIIRG